ncbi:hypothetical protein F4776DRAFT_670743 [Hypoxylon sp. NC0597]|nr:hypothetical protein F4776DRAFT_670743 [Hypoxylon sp. NC0597]
MHVRIGLRDRTIWPPRCHGQPLTEDDILWTREEDLIEKYREIERGRQLRNPLWCAQPHCSALLLEENVLDDGKDAVTCEKCETITCKTCKKAHDPKNTECKDSDSDAELEEMARSQEWMRCSHCTSMVSRIEGCIHMTCVCGHHFCYLCGATWGTCECLDAAENPNGEEHRRVLLEHERRFRDRLREIRLREDRLQELFERTPGVESENQENAPGWQQIRQSHSHAHAHPSPPISNPASPPNPWTHLEARHRRNLTPLPNPFQGQQAGSNRPGSTRPVLNPLNPQPRGGLSSMNRDPDTRSTGSFTTDNFDLILEAFRASPTSPPPRPVAQRPSPDPAPDSPSRLAREALNLMTIREASPVYPTLPHGLEMFTPDDRALEMDDMIPSPHRYNYAQSPPSAPRVRAQQRRGRTRPPRLHLPIRGPRPPPVEPSTRGGRWTEQQAANQTSRRHQYSPSVPSPLNPEVSEPMTPGRASPRSPPGRGAPRRRPRHPRRRG